VPFGIDGTEPRSDGDGTGQDAARASLRFSLLKTATDEDVDHVLRVVPEAVDRLRALAPLEASTLS